MTDLERAEAHAVEVRKHVDRARERLRMARREVFEATEALDEVQAASDAADRALRDARHANLHPVAR